MSRPHQNLDAWNQAMRLVKMTYLITQTFPKEEMYGLIASELIYLSPQHEVFAHLDGLGHLLSGLHKSIAR